MCSIYLNLLTGKGLWLGFYVLCQIKQDLECQDEKFRFHAVGFRNSAARQTFDRAMRWQKRWYRKYGNGGGPTGPMTRFRKLFQAK